MKLLLIILILNAVKSENGLWKPAPEDPKIDGLIKQVHVLFRHGHRVPMEFYPTDPNANTSVWNDHGPGQLTKLGRQQAFLLGQNLRSRYASLIKEEKPWTNIDVWSSETDRTLMSAATVVAGLLPPKGNDRWSDLNWQPVPIHSIPKESDNILYPGINCTRLEKILKGLVDEVPGYTRILYNYIADNTGLQIDLAVLAELYYTFEIERQAGLKLPYWTNLVYPEFMKNETMRFLMRPTSNKSLIRLRVGPLLQKLLKKVNEKSMLLYSTHDIILSDILGAVGIRNLNPPGAMSVVIIEYRETINGQMHAQLLWREGPNDELERLQWPNCGLRCPVEKLKENLKPLIPSDWEKECTLPVPRVKVLDLNSPALNWEVVLPILFLVMASLIFIVYIVTIRCRCGNYPYEML